MTEEVTMNSAAKHYYANKEAILQYKKQYYQQKNYKTIFLRKLHIQGMSKRDSNKVLQLAYDLNKIEFEVDSSNYSLDTLVNKFTVDSKTNVSVLGYVGEKFNGEICHSYSQRCEDFDCDVLLQTLNDDKYKLAIIVPILFFKKIEI
jgi:hypothetical protein